MNDNQRGLYSKYQVTKGGKPLDGDCFVLRPDRDPAAVAALRAYAEATPNKALARDIIGWIGAPEPLTLDQLREMDGEPVFFTWDEKATHDGWAVIAVERDDVMLMAPRHTMSASRLIGDGYKIYAHKPGGEV